MSGERADYIAVQRSGEGSGAQGGRIGPVGAILPARGPACNSATSRSPSLYAAAGLSYKALMSRISAIIIRIIGPAS